MPIKVTCQCGKSFAAKDELAGKAVKCPNCQQPLRIPQAGIAAPLPSASPPQPARPQQAAPMPPAGGGSVFDEIGLKAAPAGAMLCPGCAQPLPPNAVLCIKCGYNLKLGRRLETVRIGEGSMSGGAGHSATTADLMGKAAMMIEEEREAERAKTREGLPWWVYLIGLLFVTGFIVLMMVLPQRVALMTGGVLIYGIVIIINIYAWVRILIIAFQESPGHGVGCLLCGLYMLVYCIMRWEKCGGYFLMLFATNVIGNILAFAFGAVAAKVGNEEIQAHVPAAHMRQEIPVWHDAELARRYEGSRSHYAGSPIWNRS
jgi:hypothetical protein